MSGKEGLHVAVGIGDPDVAPGQSEAVFESTDPSGRLVIPIEGLIKTLHDSSSDWEKQNLVIQASDSNLEDYDTLFAADHRVKLNREQRTIAVDEHSIDDLTMHEFGLLEFLMLNLDKVNHRSDIYQAVWKYPFRRDDRTVDVYIRKLRKKIGDVSEELGDREQGAIRSRIGIGYYAVNSLGEK